MEQVLQTEALRVYLSLLGKEIEATKSALASIDLAGEAGLSKGIALQNQIKGLNRALDLLVEIANYEEAS
jgi:hypothetical protein